MAKRKVGKRNKVKRQRKTKSQQKLLVKRKFYNALQALKRMKPKEQRLRASVASPEFIKDISNVMKRLRTRSDLVSSKHKKILKRHKKPLQRLVKKSSSIKSKRNVLLLRGGILPILIPIIAAAIGAAGTVGASAVGAAIMKS